MNVGRGKNHKPTFVGSWSSEGSIKIRRSETYQIHISKET